MSDSPLPIRVAIGALLLAGAGSCIAQFYNDYPEPPHLYWEAEARDPMSLLLARVEAGELSLEGLEGRALVERLLAEMKIDPASQVMVFSRTSLQRRAVGPANPRAIYFNEDAYLGWMPGGRIEIASFDPDLGPLFWFQRELDSEAGPLFFRDRVCIQCHAGSATNFMPGLLGRSIYANESGRSMGPVPSFEVVGHDVPIADRWGGWYVTGGHGLRHMGNGFAERIDGSLVINRERYSHLDSLESVFPEDRYVSRGSDVLALLILDHQVGAHRRITELRYRVRQAFHEAERPETGATFEGVAGETVEELEEAADWLVDYLLFREEAALEGGPVAGTEAFRRAFFADRRATDEGRSLRDLRLEGRLFERRCSYMIHSRTFRALPPAARALVYDRIRAVLSPDSPPEGYDYFDAGERFEILAILRETIDDFPAS